MKDHMIHLGFEMGSGAPVMVPLRHMAVTGQTQQSGKTTTLEALITRSGGTALTFVTKRGEGSFASGNRVEPYFRDRADWQFVTSILDATLQEKNKFLRPWIMKICRNTRTLAEVQEKVRDALLTAKGINEGVYTQLDAYLELIVPEIERADLAETLDLRPGVNVMDVSNFATPMQMLFIQSALDWVNERCKATTVVIPEAWEFVPQAASSPVKSSATTLVRKGAGIGNHIWLDSQDMAGVDKVILRGCTVWLIGVQREANEIKRNLMNIPAGLKRPRPEEIAGLERGQFYACFAKTTVRVYVQPAWMSADEAAAIARGERDIDVTASPVPTAMESTPQKISEPVQEDEVNVAEARALREENDRLKGEIASAERRGFERGQAMGLKAGFGRAMVGVQSAIESVEEDFTTIPFGMVDAKSSATFPAESFPPKASRKTHAEAIGKGDAPAELPAPGATEMNMLGVLVRSHPQSLKPELWGLFAGKTAATAKSGPWYKSIKIMRAAGWLDETSEGFQASAAGIQAADQRPENPRSSVDLWRIWRDRIVADVGTPAMTLLRTLAEHRNFRLSHAQWGLLNGKSIASTKSGPWYTAVAALRNWDLIEGSGPFAISEKGCAILDDIPSPRTDTPEALRVARRDRLVSAQRHYEVLKRPMTRQDLAAALGISAQSAKSGPWYTAIKEMIDSGLVIDDAGTLRRVSEEIQVAKGPIS